MKEVYQKLLYVPKHGKVPEKVMLVRVGISIACIIFCLAAMSVSAYAFFTSTVTSTGSVLQSAQYDLAISSDHFTEESGVCVLDNSEGNEVKTFEFTIQTTENSTASHGYAKIVAEIPSENEVKMATFYTEPIWSWSAAEDGKPNARSYSFDVKAGEVVKLSITVNWGSCSQEPTPEGVLSSGQPDTNDEATDLTDEQIMEQNQADEKLLNNDESDLPEQSSEDQSGETVQPSEDQSGETEQFNEGSAEESDQAEQTERTDTNESSEQTNIDSGDETITQ